MCSMGATPLLGGNILLYNVLEGGGGVVGGPMHYCLGFLGIARQEMYWLTLPKLETLNPKP